jgi:hypothetical protein
MKKSPSIYLAAALLIAGTATQASVMSNGSFTFNFGNANPNVGFDPTFSPGFQASISSFPPSTIEATSPYVAGVEDYSGSSGASSYSVQPDFDTANVTWDLKAQATVPGGRRTSSFGYNPLITVGGDTLEFSIGYDVHRSGDSSQDYTIAQVQVLVGYGSGLYASDWVQLYDGFYPVALEFRDYDAPAADRSGAMGFGTYTKNSGTPDWIVRLQIVATASDYLPQDTPPTPPPGVPEPTTFALMSLGLAGIGFARKKKQI